MAKDKTGGYKQPPAHTRFKPGQSGNPSGRPKGRPNLKTLIDRAFSEKLIIKTAKGPKRVTGAELAVLKLRERVAKGDLKAIELSLKHLAATYPDRDEAQQDGTGGDAELLESYTRSVLDRERRIAGKKDE